MCFLAIALDHPARAPGEDAVGEDVVEDLVALASSGSVDRAHDALATERVEHGHDLGLSDLGVLREVAGAVRDLRARRRDEVVEHRGGDVLLCRLQAPERPLEMRSHDRLGPAQLPERCEAENGRASFALDLPQPLEHELQVRRLDPVLVFLDTPAAGSPDVDLSRRDLIEHRVHELGLDLDRLRRSARCSARPGRGSRRGRPRLSRWSSLR